MEAVKESITQMAELFNSRMAAFQQELQESQHKSSQQPSSPTTKLSSDFNKFKSFVVDALQSLQAQIEVLSDVHDQREMKSRKKILLIHGVSEDKTVPQALTDFFKSHLKVPDVDAASVKYCHRLGRRKDTKPRPLLVKFHLLSTRNAVWGAKTNLKKTDY